MSRCRNTLCKSCMRTCGKEGVKTCKDYIRFEQLNIFQVTPKRQRLPRFVSWEEYGITRERYIELRGICRSGKYHDVARLAACAAAPDIAEYILLSVEKGRSYELIEYAPKLGRIPCGKTDFYGFRRLFYHLFNQALLKDGTNQGAGCSTLYVPNNSPPP